MRNFDQLYVSFMNVDCRVYDSSRETAACCLVEHAGFVALSKTAAVSMRTAETGNSDVTTGDRPG